MQDQPYTNSLLGHVTCSGCQYSHQMLLSVRAHFIYMIAQGIHTWRCRAMLLSAFSAAAECYLS